MKSLLLDLGRLVAGAAFLYLGAEWLVQGAAGLARAFRVKPFVIGMTVVAYGTSAPELTVSIAAALEGKSGIALGNVFGSNVANLGLILGATALISPPKVEASLIRRELPVLVATSLLPPFLLLDGVLGRVDGAGLVMGALAFTLWMLRSSGGAIREAPVEARAPAAPTRSKTSLGAVAAAGLLVLVFGGKVLVDGAIGVARVAGISDRVVGLTIVAIGTSLPELAASLVAALRGHSSMAVGNVVGSNIFNVLLILGATALVRPIATSVRAIQLELVFLVGITLVGVLILRTERMVRRSEGVLLLVAYGAFIAALTR